eukprot:5928691-Pleurochrysis_carterae.AAC.6
MERERQWTSDKREREWRERGNGRATRDQKRRMHAHCISRATERCSQKMRREYERKHPAAPRIRLATLIKTKQCLTNLTRKYRPYAATECIRQDTRSIDLPRITLTSPSLADGPSAPHRLCDLLHLRRVMRLSQILLTTITDSHRGSLFSI